MNIPIASINSLTFDSLLPPTKYCSVIHTSRSGADDTYGSILMNTVRMLAIKVMRKHSHVQVDVISHCKVQAECTGLKGYEHDLRICTIHRHA